MAAMYVWAQWQADVMELATASVLVERFLFGLRYSMALVVVGVVLVLVLTLTLVDFVASCPRVQSVPNVSF